MSSSKVRRVRPPQLDYTAVWAANVLTVTTSTVHNLVTGDIVQISGNSSPQLLQVAVTVTTTTAFTVVAAPEYSRFLVGKVSIDFFRTGQVGIFPFTLPRGVGITAVIQSFVTGTGTAGYNLQGSLDGVHWTPLATVTHLGVTGDTQFVTVEPSWTYLAVSVTSIGAATKLEVLASAA